MPESVGPIRATVSRHGEAFCLAFDQIGVAAAQVATDGRWVTINERFCQLTGRTADEIRAAQLADFLHIETPILQKAATRPCSIESRISRKDGRLACLRIGLSPVRDPTTDRVGSLVLVVEDITAQKAAEQPAERGRDAARAGQEVTGRLINALEAERSRIARELHDDIGQSLAVLIVQMLRAGKPVSGAVAKKHADIPELVSRVQKIAARVGRLSHELHSSRLEYLGLEKALRGACREFSEAHRVPVDFVCEHLPAELDNGVGLCVLRVVQEALHNVAKHSRATRVSIELKGGPTELALVVADDGVGFDVSQARLSEGIGLFSMRERVHFVGGTFDLSSAPDQGTRIEAHVPVEATESREPRAESLEPKA
ncbi:MAG: ATP-binding protein [Bacteroidales bacterium]